MFKVLFSYSGWQNVNYVLNDVKNPVRTLKIAGPLGLGITSALYILANISYFVYVDHVYYPVTVPQTYPTTAHLRRRTFLRLAQLWLPCSLGTCLGVKHRKR
jgi:hypothetical protein